MESFMGSGATGRLNRAGALEELKGQGESLG